MERGIRFRSIENVLEEMKILKQKYGITYFQFQDELFIFSKKRALDFYQGFKKNNLKIKFYCQARVDIFDEETAICLKESGCQFLNFGMESSDQNVLNLMKKNTTVEQNIKAAEIARKVDIGLGLNFIWGNNGVNPKDNWNGTFIGIKFPLEVFIRRGSKVNVSSVILRFSSRVGSPVELRKPLTIIVPVVVI